MWNFNVRTFWFVCANVIVCFGCVRGLDESTQTPSTFSLNDIKCYDYYGLVPQPQRCLPPFENAAFGHLMDATNTCGEDGDSLYDTHWNSNQKEFDHRICRENDHSPAFLTDADTKGGLHTWWQSITLREGLSQVNLTLHLNKAYDVTYVKILFQSPRPRSFVIYKRTRENGPWIPWQYFSMTCRDTYGLEDVNTTPLYEQTANDDTRSLCTSEFSEISPLTGGTVVFATLERRPNGYRFDTTPALQEWVQATDIRITLDSLNTFGDEIYRNDAVQSAYYYAVADISVGARCACNGHASECVMQTALDGEQTKVCRCEHFTTGVDCNECLPFYNDAPWKRATNKDANECKPCNCNNYSDICRFDEARYNATGHGGYCMDCRKNRDGPNCEKCRHMYYEDVDGSCLPCKCNEVGSINLQCNRDGKCPCKPGVAGDKCDRCAMNHYDFNEQGCKLCGCHEAGSRNNNAACDPVTGICACKAHVEGKRCRECKPGFFNLDYNNEFGCTPCFCYGHASECSSAPGYSKVMISSYFDRNVEKWAAMDDSRRPVPVQFNNFFQNIYTTAQDRQSVYFIAPDRFLGDQRASYNRDLTFTLQVNANGTSPSATDIYLEGANTYISNTIFGQGNKIPNTNLQEYKFHLHEHPDYGWQPQLSALQFMSVLSNLTAIKIRGTYTPSGVGYLDNVRLETAQRGAPGEPALWVELCNCPNGYVGQFCESCQPGYRHSPALGGSFMPCIPCDCNKHATICDSETGKCICDHNTAGDNCELCAKGFYGNALNGSSDDCQPCGCPNNGACIIMADETLVCLECPQGYSGPQCNLCSDGYFGDPRGEHGPARDCLPCNCNHNIDPNAIGNCNRTTGECLKCVHNTRGEHCDQCLAGYYGDALAVPVGDCKPCGCYPAGTEIDQGVFLCDQLSGQCYCKEHVTGRNCDQCEDGFFDIDGGDGCLPCECDSVGSFNHTCNVFTGQCHCREGITGQHCDKCEPYKYGFSTDGCKNCDCDTIGSTGLQCSATGQCSCLNNVEGLKCDRCKENRYNRQEGCVECPSCYNLVQTAAHEHQDKLDNLRRTLDNIASNPTVIDDAEFEDQLKAMQSQIDDLLTQAKQNIGEDEQSVSDKLTDANNKLEQTSTLLDSIADLAIMLEAKTAGTKANITSAELIIDQIKALLLATEEYMNTEGKKTLDRATVKSKEFGQQNEQMSNIAHEARTRAFQLEEAAKRIEDLSFRARNTSTKAYEMAKKSIDRLVNTSDNVNSFKNVIKMAKDKMQNTKQLTKNAQMRAQEIQKNALDVLGEVNSIRVPAVNTKQLRKEANWKSEAAQKIIDDLDKIHETNAPMIKDINEEIDKVKDLLRYSDDQQQQIKELVDEAKLASLDADRAIELSNATLEEAKQTYKTLSDFDKQVQDSKAKALEALTQVQNLQDDINQSKSQLNQTQLEIAAAERNANRSRDLADEAYTRYASIAVVDAKNVKDQAENIKKVTDELNNEILAFDDRVSDTGNKLKKVEDQATNDNNLISEAKNKLGQVRTDAADAAKQVRKAIEEVNDIMSILDNLPAISTGELDLLEDKLAKVKREFDEAKLDERIQVVREEKQKQSAMIESYEKEVERLEAEVENIRNINDALPAGCFTNIKLEP